MEPKVVEETRKHFKQEVIEFDWEPVRRQPKRYGILYPIIGYIVFFGGIYCANGITEEYNKGKKIPEEFDGSSETDFPREH